MSKLIATIEVRKGTKLGYKTVVTQTHVREDGRILCATRTRGARSGSVTVLEPDGLVRIYND